jgi:hypothetical protein
VIDYTKVLLFRYPESQWTLNGDAYEGLTWLSDSTRPTKDELDAAWPEVKYAHDKASVQHARAVRYSSESDPLFFKAQRGEDGIALSDWQAAVDQIRADLPYPT